MASEPLDWDADSYDRVAGPQTSWGLDVLTRLDLRGDEVVLDAGCGSGRVTRALLERLPRGRVIAIDASPAMVAATREALGGDADVRVADLRTLELPERVDAILSTATFHWVPDHDDLFRRLFATLRPGGRLEAQCGGAGNVGVVQAALDRVCLRPQYAAQLADWPGPWRFETPDATEARLRAAGFRDVRCWLEERPSIPDDPRGFVATSVVNAHAERLPLELRDPFVDEIMAELPDPPVLDYVRLNLSATR